MLVLQEVFRDQSFLANGTLDFPKFGFTFFQVKMWTQMPWHLLASMWAMSPKNTNWADITLQVPKNEFQRDRRVEQTEEFHLATFMSAVVAGQGDNPLLMDLSNASQQLALANQSITSYGSEVSFSFWWVWAKRDSLFWDLGSQQKLWCVIYGVFPFTVVAIGVALWTWLNLQPMAAPGRGLVFLERSWRVEEGNCTGAGCTGVRRLVCNVRGARDCQMSRGRGVKSWWSKAICSSHRRTCIRTTTMLWDRSHSRFTGFLCVIFVLGMFFELLRILGLNKNGARIFAGRPWLAFSGWSFSRSSWDSCCCPCWSVWGSTGKGWWDLGTLMTTLNQGWQRLPGGKARLVSNSTRGQVSVWGFHINASIGKDGCATNERQVNSTYQTPSLTGSGAAWRTR